MLDTFVKDTINKIQSKLTIEEFPLHACGVFKMYIVSQEINSPKVYFVDSNNKNASYIDSMLAKTLSNDEWYDTFNNAILLNTDNIFIDEYLSGLNISLEEIIAHEYQHYLDDVNGVTFPPLNERDLLLGDMDSYKKWHFNLETERNAYISSFAYIPKELRTLDRFKGSEWYTNMNNDNRKTVIDTLRKRDLFNIEEKL